jgi:hypothetical protein
VHDFCCFRHLVSRQEESGGNRRFWGSLMGIETVGEQKSDRRLFLFLPDAKFVFLKCVFFSKIWLEKKN